MSGGYFYYNKYSLENISEEIERVIQLNQVPNEEGQSWNFSTETLQEFQKAITLLKQTSIYLDNIDLLLSSDISEKSFLESLNEECFLKNNIL